jgi:hypothetical protein
MSRPSPVFGVILFFWSFFTIGCFVLSVISYVHFRSISPPPFPGDPDIGAGIVFVAVLLNAFTALLWCVYALIGGIGKKGT